VETAKTQIITLSRAIKEKQEENGLIAARQGGLKEHIEFLEAENRAV